jgi:hypothetical protein
MRYFKRMFANETRQPTPVERQSHIGASPARRGCAVRSTKV